MTVKIAPSILAADPLNLLEEIQSAEKHGADLHHVDVMDGHFVPNLTFGIPLVKALKKVSKIPLCVHIMVSNPDHVALDYIEAGADYLSFHLEAATHSHRLLQAIRSAGGKAGVAVNPGTNIEHVEPLLEMLDLVNIMTVNPGFGGQSFIEPCLKKISFLRDLIDKGGFGDKIEIEVDGGVNAETVDRVRDAGASLLVAGTYFYGAKDRAAAMKTLRG